MRELDIAGQNGDGRNFIGELSIDPTSFDAVEADLLPTTDSDTNTPWGNLEDVVRNRSVRRASVLQCATDFLDRVVPLDGVSHADVVRYTVEIPARYARCFAELACGRKAEFVKMRQFVGWSGRQKQRSLLFRNNGLHIEIKTDSACMDRQDKPGQVSDVILESAATGHSGSDRKFTGIDGAQILLPA